MLEDDLNILLDASKIASKVALRFFRKNPKVWEKGSNEGPVTEADIQINDMLKKTLLSDRPDYGWLSEETEDDSERLSSDYIFIIDPIDGTRAFVDGHENYACALGIAFKGIMQAAVITMPSLDQTFWASIGSGAFQNGKKIRVSSRSQIEGSSLLSAKPNLDSVYWPGGVPPVRQFYRSSLAYRLCLAANGTFDAMVTLRDCWEWDIAAGDLIVREAGGIVTDRYGSALSFNNLKPKRPGILAGPKDIQLNLLKRL